MIKSNIKQHVVPKSYLKRFGKKNLNNKGYNIAVKQFKLNKIFIDSVDNVAFRKNFYDVSDKVNPKYWENYFSREIEPLYRPEMAGIIASLTLSNKKNDILTASQILSLSKMISFQILRVPGFLELRFKHGEIMFDETINETSQRFELHPETIKSILDDFVNNKNDFIRDMTIPLIAEKGRLDKLSEVLADKIWLIYFNNSSVPFITSDSPVVMYNCISNSVSYADNGVGRDDTFIYYPLSSKILIKIVPRNFWGGNMKSLNNTLRFLSNHDIPFVNSVNNLQAKHAERQIFVHPDFMDYLKTISNT
ncbi:DUF4238 domain-containing protein [Streptococcus sp. DD04]|uniref:DUF4238 domain-containing protein n=1 Tax=Streptococcus sp. DD04 TaxID=1776578 RepID=UPI0007947C2E|nr:DUF4238 domain-containing protein [Streptococcus sp. DD04]KXT64476.1 hypothetical protein STRDD04_01200 [Streptococcus sp. DD04]